MGNFFCLRYKTEQLYNISQQRLTSLVKWYNLLGTYFQIYVVAIRLYKSMLNLGIFHEAIQPKVFLLILIYYFDLPILRLVLGIGKCCV